MPWPPRSSRRRTARSTARPPAAIAVARPGDDHARTPSTSTSSTRPMRTSARCCGPSASAPARRSRRSSATIADRPERRAAQQALATELTALVHGPERPRGPRRRQRGALRRTASCASSTRRRWRQRGGPAARRGAGDPHAVGERPARRHGARGEPRPGAPRPWRRAAPISTTSASRRPGGRAIARPAAPRSLAGPAARQALACRGRGRVTPMIGAFATGALASALAAAGLTGIVLWLRRRRHRRRAAVRPQRRPRWRSVGFLVGLVVPARRERDRPSAHRAPARRWASRSGRYRGHGDDDPAQPYGDAVRRSLAPEWRQWLSLGGTRRARTACSAMTFSATLCGTSA